MCAKVAVSAFSAADSGLAQGASARHNPAA
jgi:hypothetical protein